MAQPKMSKQAARILRDQVNAMLAAPGGTREGRRALHVILEKNLHAARIYRGFGCLEQSAEGVARYHAHLERGRAEGFVASDEYNDEYKRVYAEAFGDDSRVVYYADRA